MLFSIWTHYAIHMDTTTDKDDIGLRIDALRKTRGMSEAELSRLANIPLTTLKRRLRGDAQTTLPELRRLSSVLGVPVSSLVEDAA